MKSANSNAHSMYSCNVSWTNVRAWYPKATKATPRLQQQSHRVKAALKIQS
jgi:hypothetical protein